ncbi:MAG: DNA polymerase III subunit delta' [Cyanobacteria bacterium P01_E01_bin.34]
MRHNTGGFVTVLEPSLISPGSGQQPPLVGQNLAIQYLKAGLRKQRLVPAYLFAGPDGVGRAIAARWFARALLCPHRFDGHDLPCGQCSSCHRISEGDRTRDNHPDLLWVEPTYRHQGKTISVSEAIAAGHTLKSPPQVRLEQVRGISQFAARTPLEAHRSVIIMTGAETLAEAAANALLKTLEEPRQAHLILLATDPALLLPTIVSRCQVLPFRRLSTAQVTAILQSVRSDTTDARPTDTSIPGIALALAQGSPGKALEAIDMWQAIPSDLIERLQQWPTSLKSSLTLGRDIAKQLDVPRQLWLLDYLQHSASSSPFPCGKTDVIKRLERARKQLRAFVQPQLVWEVALKPENG